MSDLKEHANGLSLISNDNDDRTVRYILLSGLGCFVGIRSKFQAVEMGDAMMYLGLFHHITFEHMLEDRATVYYRFAPMLLQMVPEMVQQAVRALTSFRFFSRCEV